MIVTVSCGARVVRVCWSAASRGVYSNHSCSVLLLQVVFSLTTPSTSRGPSLLSSSTWGPRISSLTSRGRRLLDLYSLPACPGWRAHRSNSFRLISPLGTKGKKLVWPIITPWPRGSKLLSLFFSPLRPDYPFIGEEVFTKQYSDFTRNVRLHEAGLIFLKAIHRNSSVRAYLLERIWMSHGVLPNAALQ